jgi:NADP-dependent 3-hydroxy acid dehydrogenase YdfG
VPTAVVTGASGGIGAATARRLAASGYDVVLGARRGDRLREVAASCGGTPVELDVASTASVEAFCAEVDRCDVLVNNAGGALGLDRLEDADEERWRAMYESNVLGSVRMTKALLPRLEASGDGCIVMVGSIAGWEPYEGGSGYNAAKFALRAATRALRYELLGRPVRVASVDPGMVETDFSLVRFGGDAERAAQVYAGVDALSADDVAECIAFVVSRPAHVNIDTMVVMPRDQAGPGRVHRRS